MLFTEGTNKRKPATGENRAGQNVNHLESEITCPTQYTLTS